MKISRETLEANRKENMNLYGYKKSYCKFQSCCEECDRKIRIGCEVIRKIEDLQVKRILKICE